MMLLSALAGLAVVAGALGLTVGSLAMAGEVSAARMSSAGAEGGGFEGFVRTFTSDRDSLTRFYDLSWSEARLERLERHLAETRASLAGVDFGTLDVQGRIDWLLMRDLVEGEVGRQRLERSRLEEMDHLLPMRREIQGLELARWRMEPLDVRASAEVVSRVKGAVKGIRDRVERGRKGEEAKEGEASGIKVSPVLARRAAGAVGSLRRQLRTWYDFHAGYKPEFGWWVRRPYEEASAALEEYATYLREQIAGQKGEEGDPLLGDPIGREALMADLRREVIPYSPEELVEIGRRELEWCRPEMERAAGEMGLGGDWKAALERVKGLSEPPGRQDDLVAGQAREAIEFLRARDMLTIPPLAEETWRLSMISAEGQRTLPFAAYSNQAMLVAYPTEAMPHDDKVMSMRGNNRHFTRIVTAHELIPGHHLQLFMAERHRPYRRVFSTPFFVEGWALYWEMLLWDEGFARGPEDRIGMLFWRMHRCARIVVSLEFHLGRMTPEEMVEFLVDRVGHERFPARSEVRRYIAGDYSPLYQVSYMIGGLQLRALRREVVDSGRLGAKAFHDELLRQGPIPIEYVRSALLGLPLEREHAPSWRFAD